MLSQLVALFFWVIELFTDLILWCIRKCRIAVGADAFVRIIKVNVEPTTDVHVDFDAWSIVSMILGYILALQCPRVVYLPKFPADGLKRYAILTIYDCYADDVFQVLIDTYKRHESRMWSSCELIEMRNKNKKIFPLPLVAILTVDRQEINVSKVLNNILFVDDITLLDLTKLLVAVSLITVNDDISSAETISLSVLRPDTGTEQTYSQDDHLCF